MPITAALVAGGIAAAGTVMAGNAAAGATSDASAASINEQRRQFDLARQDIAPWQQAGVSSLDQIKALLGLGGTAPDFSAFTSQPDYQFALDQGLQALNRNAAASGNLMSGEMGKSLVTFGQGLASQKFSDYYNRLANLAGIGANVTQNLNSLGSNVAGNIGNTLMAAGQGRASSYLNTGNTVADLSSGLASNYIFNNQLGSLLRGYAPGAGGTSPMSTWSPTPVNLASYAPVYGS